MPAHGPLGLLLIDAHADTWEDYYGERLFHGTVIRRATEEGLLDPARSLIAGLRGSLYEPADLEDARALGFELVGIDELRASRPDAFAARVRERLGAGAAFLGFDIDAVDPSAAPGTGTPEVGGLLAGEALELLRALAGIRFAGYDVVEVSPPYDSRGRSRRCWRPTSHTRCWRWLRWRIWVGSGHEARKERERPCSRRAPSTPLGELFAVTPALPHS